MIGRIGTVGGLAAALGLVGAGATGADSVLGLWKTPIDGGSIVKLGPCGDSLCGWVFSSPHLRANPDQRDVRNRDPAQRGRLLHDLLVLKVRVLGPNRWGEGWAYNPEDGGTYRGSMERVADGSLRVTGCIVAPFCKTQTWTRAE